MLTKNEINTLNLSPTKKDFVQIWNELLEVAGKLSERWDPTSTNESDPGIVILKALTGIADKLNYNIDKNTLEAFMPTAAQEDSMRKLCDMLGYNIKYYQSAETEVTIKYHNSEPSEAEETLMKNEGLYIPKFTVVTNNDQDISYFTVNERDYFISADNPSVRIKCLEGQIVKCESFNDSNVITANQISENNRFYLPETQIAENGFFIYNVFSDNTPSNLNHDGTPWEKVDNLNTCARGSRVFKFGFDSYESRPYVEFPEDYSELFKDGIFIYYTRTNGVNGNISVRTLTQLELPNALNWDKVSAGSFSVENIQAATTGTNVETIKQAYNNFKKTIGTFETLVTCRDYMNRVYTMVNEYNKPLVSNVLVTDIRNDLNRAITICSCDDAGIFYKETPILVAEHKIVENKVDLTNIQTTPYSLVGKEEDYEYELVGQEEDYEYELVGQEEDYEFAVVDEGEFELVGQEEDYEYELVESSTGPVEEISEEISDPVVESEETETTYIISEANKPVYGDPIVIQFGSLGSGGAFRGTNWRLGTSTGLPLFADEYSDSFIKENYANFKGSLTGEAVAVDSAGNESPVWYIKQGDTFFKTTLPITKVASTEKTVVKEQTKTITNQVVETIKEQRTLREQRTLKEQRTLNAQRTLREQRTLKEQSLKTETYTDTSVVANEYAIDHFDLVFYPFKAYKQIKSNVKNIREVYDTSFDYASDGLVEEIDSRLKAENLKTISHKIIPPRPNDIVSINNYYRLNTTIVTNSKITAEEGTIITEKIKIALANAFNMHELDFGEEIPFDSIVEVIENADPRIRVASLNEPALYTTFSRYEGMEAGAPKIVEYAVASDWLSDEDAEITGRFELEDISGKTIKTFNTKEAKEIYNKLAIRNVLAGRVPLFTYDDTFKISFSEGAYQVTTGLLDTKPIETLPDPKDDNPFTIWTEEDKIYTGQLINGIPKYTETYTPEDHDVIKDISDNVITDISTNLEINSENGEISNIALKDGEFIKFRAPNFITTKTYPAYVNYHLVRNKASLLDARSASAETLFDLLDKDRGQWTAENNNIKWQKVLDYFAKIDTQKQTKYKKKFTLSQKISKYTQAASSGEDLCSSMANESGQHVLDHNSNKCIYCGVPMMDPIQKGPIIIDINNTSSTNNSEASAEDLLAKSGCVKLINKDFKAILKWDPSEGELPPSADGPDLAIELNIGNPFIVVSSLFNDIQDAVSTRLGELKSQVLADGKTPVLPTTCGWTISFEFECVPFEPASLTEWENFINSEGKTLFGFTPVSEHGKVLWREFGSGYPIGRAIRPSSEKLLTFDSSHFGLLNNYASRLRGIFITEDLGKNAETAIIDNDVEYELEEGEYLYIEYTPSSTTEEGTTQELPAVTKIHGPGTIIRPRGFTEGLMDSEDYKSLGNSPHKTVPFEAEGRSTPIEMYRFGANEQVELRELAQVEFSKETPNILVYKNFNDCKELETGSGLRKYTLKDGEYIFYTDEQKAEFAYFTTGTQIVLTGALTLPRFDVIDLATIFDSGLHEIPWAPLTISNGKIIFQEYQYITLGPNDTLGSLTLENEAKSLTSAWEYCDNVTYYLADSENPVNLAAINVTLPESPEQATKPNKGNGWEVCSILELNVSPSNTQTLRKTDNITTSLSLLNTPAGGDASMAKSITIEPTQSLGDADSPTELSFKTNLICQPGSNQINIEDVYLNPDKLKGFEVKIFAKDGPTIVKTKPNKVVPFDNIVDITKWTGSDILTKEPSDLWYSVDLEKITVKNTAESDVENNSVDISYDNALRLPLCVLPNTYGIFSIYLKYAEGTSSSAETWIETIPGTTTKDITLLNSIESSIKRESAPSGTNNSDKLYLKPGLNCIRLNKTSKIFIKTSTDSQGMLYFDEPRLVKCQLVKYKTDSINVDTTTQGLNLKQLGYFRTVDSAIFDSEVLEKLKIACAEKSYTSLGDIEQSTKDSFTGYYNRLLENKSKIDALAVFTEAVEAETNKLLTTYPPEVIESQEKDHQYIIDLFNMYKQISEALSRENELLVALNDNKDIDSLEQQLAGIFESFSTIEVAQQQLRVDLENLKTKALANIDLLSLADIKDDFTFSAFASLFPSETEEAELTNVNNARVNMVDAAKALVETQFFEQLNALADEIEKVANSTERGRLLTVINNLQSNEITNTRVELAAKIVKLTETLEHTDIDSLLASGYAAALEADYATLASSLAEVHGLLSHRELELLVHEIELAVSNNGDDILATLLVELEALINSAVPAEDVLNSLTDLIEKVEAKIPDPTLAGTLTQGAIITKVTDLREDVAKKYKIQLNTIIDDILIILEKLTEYENSYSDIISNLQKTQDTQVVDIVDKLNKIIEQRSTNIGLAEEEDISFLDLSTQETLISSVWLDYMKQDFYEGLQSLYEDLSYEISSLTAGATDQLSLPDPFVLETKYNDLQERQALIKAVNFTAFSDLFEQVKDLAQRHKQDSASKKLIDEISYLLLPLSVDIENAKAAISSLNDKTLDRERNEIIIGIIEKLDTLLATHDSEDEELDIMKKQQLLKSLRAELNSAILLDTQLFNIVANLLCPSISLFEEKLPYDAFYEKLKAVVDKAQKDILRNTEHPSALLLKLNTEFKKIKFASKELADLLNNSNLSEFTQKALSLDFLNLNNYLPDFYLDYLVELRDVVGLQNEIQNVKAADFFTDLPTKLSSVNIEEWRKGHADTLSYSQLSDILNKLTAELVELEKAKEVPEAAKDVCIILAKENQLLAEIRAIDTNRDFYYNTPIEASLAIEFNENNDKLNTLLNPSFNYDINNVNNNFVISKLDIDYLDKGIQIARSSRLT